MKEETEIISKEEIDKVINVLNEAEKESIAEDEKLSITKVKEVISDFEGHTTQTIVGILNTAFLLLPVGAIMAVMDMGKKAFLAKFTVELGKSINKECSDCNCKASKTREE